METISGILNDFLAVMKTFQFKDAIDILIITFIIYSAFKLVRETRAEQLLKGILILLVIYFVSIFLNFTMLTQLIRLIVESGVV